MNRKMKKVMAFIVSLVLVCSSFLEFAVPVKAAQTGFATGATIISDTSLDYCWSNSTVSLSVVALVGTDVEWSITKADGSAAEDITLEAVSDTEASNGVSKNIVLAIGETAAGEYKVTAVAAEDTPRSVKITVRDTLAPIAGVVETDFNNQFTGTSFEIKTVVDRRYVDSFQWNSSDEKVTIENLENKSDAATYPGGVVKYAKLTLAGEKPANGTVTVTATANEKSKEQQIVVKKAATSVEDVKVTACNNGEDIKVKPHMDSDTIYVDMGETITLSGVVRGTEISESAVDDRMILSCTENDGNFGGGLAAAKIINSTDYSFDYAISGQKATSGKYKVSVLTESGQASKSYNIAVLAPVTQIGIVRAENYDIFKNTLRYYNVMENTSNEKYLLARTVRTDDTDGSSTAIEDKGTTMVAGDSMKLAAVFRGQFDGNKNWICASTDAVKWVSTDENIATITSDGEVKAVRSGSVDILCSAKETQTSSRNTLVAKYSITVETFKPAVKVSITKGEGTDATVIEKDTILTNQKDAVNKYSAVLQGENGGSSNDRVVWASSDEGIFTVDESGNVTPVSRGKAVLTARAVNSGVSASINIEVVAAVEKITLKSEMTGAGVCGHKYLFQAQVNAGADENEELTWTSEDSKIVFIDPKDSTQTELSEFKGKEVYVLVKGETGIGKLTVKGKYLASAVATYSFQCTEAVEAETVVIKYNNEDVSEKSFSVNKGNNIVLDAEILGANKIPSNDDYIWEIKDEKNVVEVVNTQTTGDSLINISKLTLKPLTKGNIEVTLRDLQTNRLSTTVIQILVPATDLKLKETDEKMVLALGDSYTLQTEVLPEDTSDKIKFESSAPDIISVDENGKITALSYSEETVIITASINDNLKATMQVKSAIPVEAITAADSEGHKLDNNSVISILNKKDLDIVLDCGKSTELFKWTTSNETVASVRVSDDTYTCTIHANSAGIVNIVAESTVTKQKMTFRVYVAASAMDINGVAVDFVEKNVSYTFDGKEVKPEIKVTYSNLELLENLEYTVSYENNSNVGIGKVIITGIGKYTGTKTVTFKITQRDINSAQAAKINDVAYTGTKATPAVTLTDLGRRLVKDTDYTLSYSNNYNAGTATVTINGTGNYGGTKTITFKIVPQNLSKVKVDKIANQIYTGNAITPSLTVTNGTTSMYVNGDYTVTYSSNKNPGKAKAVIKGIGNYTGSKTVYFYVVPAKAQLNSVISTSAKSMKLKWKKDSKATGYEIYYATKSSFSKSSRKAVTISKYKTTSKTIKKLKSNKTYYVKIRAYKKVGSKKLYGDWSNVTMVTIK